MAIGTYILVFFLSATKFLFAPGTSLSMLSYWETIALTIAGGWTGVSFFYFSAGAIFRRMEARRERQETLQRAEGRFVPRPKFTRMNKLTVRTKRRFGLIGLSIITPAIISIPFGSVILARFYPNWRVTIPVLFCFVVLWSFFLTTFGSYIFRLLGWN